MFYVSCLDVSDSYMLIIKDIGTYISFFVSKSDTGKDIHNGKVD